MTLSVVCGSGHVIAYNLTHVPQGCWRGGQEGGNSAVWDWDYWQCPYKDCEHKEYASHTVDKDWQYREEKTTSEKTLMAALLLLSFVLTATAKTRMGW